ncbi:MAG TPA: RNA methyltransferase [Ktedonobacteraceae bacterium]|jgi:TrmH family RNA methyltransferase
MTRITSLTNARVVRVRDLQTTRGRKKSGLLLMEGPHLCAALMASEQPPQEIYYQPELLERTPQGRDLLASLLHAPPTWAQVALCEVDLRVAEALSDTHTSQGILCVVSTRLFEPQRLLARRKPGRRPALLILDDLADPGNLGTLLRTALAADVEEVLLTEGCADCYSPKVVRAASGAHLALPLWADLPWPAIAARIADHGVVGSERVFLAEASGAQPYYAENLALPFALIIGNEAHGPSPQASTLAGQALRIPLANEVESLNAAMAAGIILFESVRQQRLLWA